MKLCFNYDNEIISLPKEAVMKRLKELKEAELRVLIYAAADPNFRSDPADCRAKAVKATGMQWAQIEEAYTDLCKRGIFKSEEKELPEEKKGHITVKADSPNYSRDEVAGIAERDEVKALIADMGGHLGKLLSQGEVMTVVSMYDYLHLSPQFLLMLADFCVDIDKKSLRYIERMAYSMFDADITDVKALEVYLENERRKYSITARIRELFGIGERAFTEKEKRLIDTWLDTYKLPIEIIRRAYAITVDRINEPSLDYASAILKKWHESGYSTLEEVTSEGAKAPAPKKQAAESFDPDEFATRALKRGLKTNK